MYSMVLMAAMVPSGDTAAFGKHKNGCDGGGCTGVVDSGSCHGKHGGGFLGMRGNSCNGGGFLGHKSSNSCNGGGFLGGLHKHKGNGCTGYAEPSCGCCGSAPAAIGCAGSGGVVVPPPPVVMPKPEPTPVPKTLPKKSTD